MALTHNINKLPEVGRLSINNYEGRKGVGSVVNERASNVFRTVVTHVVMPTDVCRGASRVVDSGAWRALVCQAYTVHKNSHHAYVFRRIPLSTLVNTRFTTVVAVMHFQRQRLWLKTLVGGEGGD